jgi:hypothetical protein
MTVIDFGTTGWKQKLHEIVKLLTVSTRSKIGLNRCRLKIKSRRSKVKDYNLINKEKGIMNPFDVPVDIPGLI